MLKLNRNSNLLRYSQHLIPETTKKLIYHAHIESHIQYGLLLWGNNVQKDQINKLQKIQTKCMKYITTCKGNPHTRTRILPIKSLISLVNYKFGYQVQRSQLPKKIMESTLKDSKNTSLLPNHVYNTRNKRFPNLPKKMTLEYQNSFLCKGPRSLLELDTETRNKVSLYTFTKACKDLLLSKVH